MSRMGVAIGVEAAHLLHFPNFCRDKNIKSVITFIDENADREMNFFVDDTAIISRYRLPIITT